MKSINKQLAVSLSKSDVFLAISILFVCIAPYISSSLVIAALIINLFRLFMYDIHTFMFDITCLMPFANIYKIAPATPSLVLVLIVIGALWYFLKEISNRKPLPTVLYIACLYLLLRSSLLIDAFVSILCSLLLICIFAINVNDSDVVKVAYGYVISVTVSVIAAYLSLSSNTYIDYTSDEIQVGAFTDAIRFKGLFTDPNYLGTYLLSAISVLCQLLVIKKINIKVFILLFAIMTYAGIISYSKSFFLTIIVLLALVMFYLWRKGEKKWAALFSVGFIILLAYSLKGGISDVNIIMARFDQDADLNDLTTGRTSLWSRYLDVILSSIFVFFVGKGLDAPILGLGAHNLYLETLFYVGTIGLVLLFSSVFSSFRTTFKRFKQYNLLYKGLASLTLLILLIVYWALQGLFSFATYFQFFIAVLMFRLPSLKEKR